MKKLAEFRAGPMCGNKALQPAAVRREIIVPITMNKLLIFVVDLTACRLLDPEPRKVEEMKEDIADALGVTAQGKTMQVIFAGYDGPKRQAINEDQELNDFFTKFDVTMEGEACEDEGDKKSLYPEVQKKRQQEEQAFQEQMGMTRQQLSQLRLGGIVTKIQMVKYIRKLGDAKKKNVDLEVEKYEAELNAAALKKEIAALTLTYQQLQDQHEEVVASIPGQIEMATIKAVHQAQIEFMTEKEQALKEQGVQLVKEHHDKMKAEINKIQKKNRQVLHRVENERDQVKETLEKSVARCEKAERELEATKKLLKAKNSELEELKKEAEASRDEMSNRMASEGSEMKQKLLELEAQYESCRSQLETCITLLEDNQIPLPGRVIKDEEKIFKWRLPKVSDKLENYQKDHAIQSPEFTLWGLKGLQVEFFPNGIQGSYPGWAALKLRIPRLHAVEGKTNRVQLNWKVSVGATVLGPRRDDFCEDYWWCCKGTVMWPNFAKQEMLKKQIEDDTLPVVVEFLEATVQLVDAGDKVPPRSKSSAGLKLLPELKHLKGDRQVVISWKGKIVDDKSLLDYVLNYLSSATKTSVCSPKHLGSIMWDGRSTPSTMRSTHPSTSLQARSRAELERPSTSVMLPSDGLYKSAFGEFDAFCGSPSPTNRLGNTPSRQGGTFPRFEDEEDVLFRSCSPLKSSRCSSPNGKSRSGCSSPMGKPRPHCRFPGSPIKTRTAFQ